MSFSNSGTIPFIHLLTSVCHPPDFILCSGTHGHLAPLLRSLILMLHLTSSFFPTLVTPWPTTHQPPEALVTALGWVGGYPLVLFWPSSALPGCLNYQSGCLSHPFLFGQFNHAHPLQTPRAPLAISPHTGMLVDQ